MIFPRLVYRKGTENKHPMGYFDILSVDDIQTHTEALHNGWYPTLLEAFEERHLEAIPKLHKDEKEAEELPKVKKAAKPKVKGK